MKRLTLVIVAAALLAGCTHTRALDTASPEARTRLNARAEEATATLVLRNGESHAARPVHIAPDLTTWTDPSTEEARSVPTRQVASVRFDDQGRGVLEGIGLGAAVPSCLSTERPSCAPSWGVPGLVWVRWRA